MFAYVGVQLSTSRKTAHDSSIFVEHLRKCSSALSIAWSSIMHWPTAGEVPTSRQVMPRDATWALQKGSHDNSMAAPWQQLEGFENSHETSPVLGNTEVDQH